MDLTSLLKKCSQPESEHFFHEAKQLQRSYSHLSPEDGAIALVPLSKLAHTSPALQLPDEFKFLLSPKEINQLTEYRFEKRYREWLGGRLAAKLSIMTFYKQTSLSMPGPESISIFPDENGKPIILPALPPLINTSISHSGEYAAAIVSTNSDTGIDIQRIEPKIDKLTERFTNPKEKSLFCDNSSETQHNTIIWATKEAVKKSMLHSQPSFFSGINIEHAIKLENKKWKVTCSVAAQGEIKGAIIMIDQLKNYILAVAEGGNDA